MGGGSLGVGGDRMNNDEFFGDVFLRSTRDLGIALMSGSRICRAEGRRARGTTHLELSGSRVGGGGLPITSDLIVGKIPLD
jgi:hypothetical protein